MARYVGSRCKLCRRAGEKLFLKGTKCDVKCTLDNKKRRKPPGQHGDKRTKLTDYGTRLREKQLARWISGITERQFRRVFGDAERIPGVTGTNLLRLLETRLDNVVYRLGVGLSRVQARQFVTHGHITVNGKKVGIPSYAVKIGDVVGVRNKLQVNVFYKESRELASSRQLPGWLSFDPEQQTGKLIRYPERDEISYPVSEQFIVEFYSR